MKNDFNSKLFEKLILNTLTIPELLELYKKNFIDKDNLIIIIDKYYRNLHNVPSNSDYIS